MLKLKPTADISADDWTKFILNLWTRHTICSNFWKQILILGTSDDIKDAWTWIYAQIMIKEHKPPATTGNFKTFICIKYNEVPRLIRDTSNSWSPLDFQKMYSWEGLIWSIQCQTQITVLYLTITHLLFRLNHAWTKLFKT